MKEIVFSPTGSTMRFGELASAMTDISERMLTVRLKSLESHHLIERRCYRELPPGWNTP